MTQASSPSTAAPSRDIWTTIVGSSYRLRIAGLSDLNMDHISHLRDEISNHTRILSLITRRIPDFGEKDTEPLHPDDREASPETKDIHTDETDFDSPIAPPDLDAVKRSALDRLAEVLARYKTARGSRVQDGRHSDAKHVTSVMMVEETGGESVTFLCAKNEGLDGVDLVFLGKLEGLLRDVASKGER
jgi:hypothetical protein